MTTVLGVARDGVVYMAADSLVSVCERPMPGAVRKVLRLPAAEGHEVLIGVSGDGAMAGIARRGLSVDRVPEPGEDPQEFADQIAEVISELARDAGILQDGRMDAMLLLGWAGRLWTLIHSQAIPHPDGVAVTGSGADIALGAVDVLLDLGTEPGEAVVRAVQVAIPRDLNSGGPVVVEILQPPKGWTVAPPQIAEELVSRG